MRAFLDRMLTSIREYFSKTTRKDKIRLAILSVVVIALAIVAVVLLSRTNYVTLYTAQDIAEAGTIYEALQQMNVPARVEETNVLVPEGRASELRATLASQGVIGAQEANLDILNSASGFSITDSQATKLYEAQRAAEIRSQILASPKIKNCQVIVNFGKSSPFLTADNIADATASVMLVLYDNTTLTTNDARTIAEMVRNSIPGIKYENITISDSNLNVYPVTEADMTAAPATTASPDMDVTSRVTLQNLLSSQLQDQGEQLLTPIFGASNVKVAATVRLNFDKVSENSVVFEPPVPGEIDGIVRSLSDTLETQKGTDTTGGVPGTDTNGMGTVEYPYGTLNDGDVYSRQVTEKNYEINETTTQIEKESGKIEFLSIGVMLNSNVVDSAYSAEVANIVAKGFGVQPENVAVEFVPFPDQGSSLADQYSKWEEYEKATQRKELLQMVLMWAVILLLGLSFMLLVRMIVRAIKPPPPPPEPVLVEGRVIDYTADDEEEYDFDEEHVEIEDIELNKKSTGLEQIERFIEKDPSAVAQLLRNWLSDE